MMDWDAGYTAGNSRASEREARQFEKMKCQFCGVECVRTSDGYFCGKCELGQPSAAGVQLKGDARINTLKQALDWVSAEALRDQERLYELEVLHKRDGEAYATLARMYRELLDVRTRGNPWQKWRLLPQTHHPDVVPMFTATRRPPASATKHALLFKT